MKRLTCPYCKRSFRPHPRVGNRQKTCGKPSCKKTRKAEINRRWRRDNPDCCQNDYPRVKEWLGQHPHYLVQYRQSHPEYVQRNREAQKHRDRSKKIHLDIQSANDNGKVTHCDNGKVTHPPLIDRRINQDGYGDPS